jgi:hypothetical protein
MELLKNNYMRGHGHGDTWTVEIDPPTRQVKSYYEETCIAAEMIWAERQGPLQLCYSGGLDSEYVLSVLLALGMNVETVIMRTQYNEHETKYAFKYCEERNIKPTVIDLDYDKFVESGQLLEIATNMESSMWALAANMWLCSQLDGTVITGNDPPHMQKKSDGLWYLDEEEYIHSQFNYYKKYNIYGTPFLLSYTPELMLSFLLDPTMVKLANNEIPGKLGTNSTKVHVFNNNNGNFELENRPKLHGYEKVVSSPIYNHPDIQKVRTYQDKWMGRSDHQYHTVVERLQNGKTSIEKHSGN